MVQISRVEALKSELEIWLEEYSKLRDEILEIHRAIRQLSITAFLAIAGLATLIITLTNQDKVYFLPVTLLLLPLPFTGLLLSFIGHLNGIMNIGDYIEGHIASRVNEIFYELYSATPPKKLLSWESFTPRNNIVNRWISEGFWAGGQSILMIVPLIGSLIGYCFVINDFSSKIPIWWHLLLAIDVGLLVISLFIALFALRKRGLLSKRVRSHPKPTQ